MKQIGSAILELVQSQAWAITEDMYETINEVLYRRLTGQDPLSFEAKEPKAGTVSLVGNSQVAVLPIHGIIAKRMNMFHDISGGVSTEMITDDFLALVENKDIDAIVLDIDSPGGTVDGTKQLADIIHANRSKKPILAYANGTMASAAYWIGSAAEKVTAYDTAHVGSIGVITTHTDKSQQDANLGIKRTHIYAGKYKALGSDNEPLTAEAKEYIQQNFVDEMYSIFVNSVAKNRGVSTEVVQKKMADGQSFLATKALSVGLIDKIMSLDDTIAWAASRARRRQSMDKFRVKDEAVIDSLMVLDELYDREDEILAIETISYEDVL